MENTYAISTIETMKSYTVTITFAEPFRVGDPDAWNAARVRILNFMKMNRVSYSSHGKTKRIDDKTFQLKIAK